MFDPPPRGPEIAEAAWPGWYYTRRKDRNQIRGVRMKLSSKQRITAVAIFVAVFACGTAFGAPMKAKFSSVKGDVKAR